MKNNIVCDFCAKEFTLKTDDIKSSNLMIDGNELNALYFACPRCGEVFVIQIKDGLYTELQSDLQKQINHYNNIPFTLNFDQEKRKSFLGVMAKRSKLEDHDKHLKEMYEQKIKLNLKCK